MYIFVALILPLMLWFIIHKLLMANPAKDVKIRGYVAPGFEPVRDLFEDNFLRGVEASAQCCAYLGQEKMVDLWASVDSDDSYDSDSLSIVFSNSKIISAIVFSKLVDKGLVQYSDMISKHWPEFARNGKGDIKIEDVMRHEAGLANIFGAISEETFTPEGMKSNAIGKLVENAKLKFPDAKYKTDRQYHTSSHGYILNELFRRLDPERRTIGQVLRKEISEPLGIQVHFGLTDEEVKRVAKCKNGNKYWIVLQHLLPKCLGSTVEGNPYGYFKGVAKAYRVSKIRLKKRFFPWVRASKEFSLADFSVWCDPTYLKGEIVSRNAHCSAPGLARLAAVMANKGRMGEFQLMSGETWNIMHGCHSTKRDVIQDFGRSYQSTYSRGGLFYNRYYSSSSDEMDDFTKSVLKMK